MYDECPGDIRHMRVMLTWPSLINSWGHLISVTDMTRSCRLSCRIRQHKTALPQNSLPKATAHLEDQYTQIKRSKGRMKGVAAIILVSLLVSSAFAARWAIMSFGRGCALQSWSADPAGTLWIWHQYVTLSIRPTLQQVLLAEIYIDKTQGYMTVNTSP